MKFNFEIKFERTFEQIASSLLYKFGHISRNFALTASTEALSPK